MSRNVLVHKLLPTDDELRMKDTISSGKLIFTNFQNMICGFLLRENRLLAARCFPANSEKLGIGSIYIARVRDVSPNIHAYFLELQKGIVAYMPEDAVENPVLTNRKYEGKILCGDELLVQIVKDAQKGKKIQVSTKLIFYSTEKDQEKLLENAIHRSCFSCVQKAKPAWHSFFDCVKSDEYNEIITDQEEIYNELLQIQGAVASGKSIRLYQDSSFSLSKLYSLETKFKEATETRIWLKSGAFLVIEHTEALTVIDVNSGKYEAKKANEEYFFRINSEAAKEIAVQLRLRNISGIIIVDFINMKSSEQKQKLIQEMRSFLSEDICKCYVIDITPLGLMEITRKKTYKPLLEQIKENHENIRTSKGT